MDRKPSVLAKKLEVAVTLAIMLVVSGIVAAAAVGSSMGSSGPPSLTRPSDWQPSTPRSEHVVEAFLEMEHGSYRATLTRAVTVWQTVQDLEQAQKFAGSYPAGTPLAPSLSHAIACRLPAGAHVVADPWPGPRYEEVMTPDGPAGYCDGVARVVP